MTPDLYADRILLLPEPIGLPVEAGITNQALCQKMNFLLMHYFPLQQYDFWLRLFFKRCPTLHEQKTLNTEKNEKLDSS